MSEGELLFVKHDSLAAQANQPRVLVEAIETHDPNAILTANIDDLVGHFVDKFRIDVPRLIEDDITLAPEDTRFDARRDSNRIVFDPSRPVWIPGTRLTWHVPYEGERELFYMRASTFTLNPPRAVVTEGEIQFPYTTADANDAPRLKTEFERDLAKVRDHLSWLERDFKPFMDGIATLTRGLIDKRREKLKADRSVAASLGYRVRERDDATRTYSVPTRRKPTPTSVPKGTRAAALEPALDDKTYEGILETCAAMATVIEQHPATFVSLSEPDIRSHFLVQLNGQFPGGATGETFNAAGKTDILLKQDGKNVFIAECKFWDGPKSVTDALAQVLSYATWRDSKLALFVFSKGRNFTEVVRGIDETIAANPAVVRRVGAYGESGFRYVLARPDDRERQAVLTVLAFAIPPTAKSASRPKARARQR